MGHVPMLVEEHDDDDVSPAATGIKLSKRRVGFAYISALSTPVWRDAK